MEKKIIWFVGVTGLMLSNSIVSIAAQKDKDSVYIQSEEDSWEVGASALFLQPSNSEDFAYATVTELNGNQQTHNVDRDFDWGYDIFARYNFEDSDRDLTLAYTHFSSGDSDNLDISPLSTDYLYNQFTYTAEGHVDSEFNMVDLLAGQHVNFGADLEVHFVAGVSYADVKQDESVAYDQGLGKNTSNAPFAQESYEKFDSDFWGVGPKFGIDADYEIDESDFGLVGGVSYALLIGSQSHSNDVKTATTDPTQSFTYEKNDFDDNSMVVSNINANLGFRYEYDYSDEDEQSIDLELGYQINQFLDAAYDSNDVNFAGPYLTLAVSY